MRFPRSSGILLHVTSLPGPGPIGDLGEEGYRFVDFLEESGQALWEILPLSPLGYGNSPYSSPSAFAVNPLLLSMEALEKDGWLSRNDLPARASASAVDFSSAHALARAAVDLAWKSFQSRRGKDGKAFEEFRRRHAYWIEDYALFVALKENFRGLPWYKWPPELVAREDGALKRWRGTLSEAVAKVAFGQFLFFGQWERLRKYANLKGIKIVGDIPIFVNHDSADAWAYRDYFFLDKKDGSRLALSGVPPDQFSSASQIWGNPLYDWEAQARDNFSWWTRRLGAMLDLVDVIRVDHFTGFRACWHVPLHAKTSAEGKWVDGPGKRLFDAAASELGELPIIAEDLGPIPHLVDPLLLETGFPCTRVIHYAFDSDEKNPHLPENYPANCAAYTGTHDNDTTIGWFANSPQWKREKLLRYLKSDGAEINWKLMRVVSASVADLAILPLQDPLALGSEARMNQPGVSGRQWSWRYGKGMLTAKIAKRLADLTADTGR